MFRVLLVGVRVLRFMPVEEWHRAKLTPLNRLESGIHIPNRPMTCCAYYRTATASSRQYFVRSPETYSHENDSKNRTKSYS